MDKVDVANRALAYLMDRDYMWCSTIPMMKTLGLKDTTGVRSQFRTVLDRLRIAGRVLKKGEGKFTWKINCSDWDKSSPFKNKDGVVVAEPSPSLDEDDDEPAPQRKGISEEEFERRLKGSAAPHGASNGTAAVATAPGIDMETFNHIHRLNNEVKDLKTTVKVHESVNASLSLKIEELREEVTAVRKKAEEGGMSVKTLRVEKYDGKVIELKNVTLPAWFQRAVELAKCRRNILLVGPAGCGKSTVSELLAKTLDLQFGKVGGSGGLSEVHLLGRSTPNLTNGKANFTSTDFVNCYENGGLCLVDELDGADPNVLLALNPALDRSGTLPLPGRPDKPAKKHKDFVCVATANTVGRGATRQYAGRNQLDESTLDRFRIGVIECDYDAAVERAVCPDDKLRTRLQGIREKITAAGLRRVLSTRFLEDAFVMTQSCGWEVDEVVKQFLSGWGSDEKAKIGEGK